MILSLANSAEQSLGYPRGPVTSSPRYKVPEEIMTENVVSPAFIRRLFVSITERGCVLAPVRFKALGDQDIFDGDYDFVISPSDVAETLRAIREFLTGHGVDFAIYRRKFGKIRLAILSDDRSAQLIIELWQELEARTLPDTYPALLWQHLQPHIQPDPESLTGYRIAPDVEAAYYLCHLLEKGKKIGQGMTSLRLMRYRDSRELSAEISALVALVRTDADIPAAAISARDFLVSRHILQRSKGPREKFLAAISRIPAMLFKLRLSIAGSHRFIDFIGPDGVGKTSLIEAASGEVFPSGKYFRFKKTYRKSISYSIVHPMLKRLYQRQRGEKLAKNQVDDMSSGFLFYISIAGVFWRNLVCMLTGRLYLSDRSPADLLVAGYRFQDRGIAMRSTAPRDIRFMPTPRAVVHLHAPSEVITSRKQEMNAKQIGEYQEAVFNVYLLKAPPTYICINTNCSLTQSVSALAALANKGAGPNN
jgi:thymidylate kinase